MEVSSYRDFENVEMQRLTVSRQPCDSTSVLIIRDVFIFANPLRYYSVYTPDFFRCFNSYGSQGLHLP